MLRPKVYLHLKHARFSSPAGREKVSDVVQEQHRKKIKQNANFMYACRNRRVKKEDENSHSNCKLRTLGFSDPRRSLFLTQTGSQWEHGSATSSRTGSQFRVTLVKTLLPLLIKNKKKMKPQIRVFCWFAPFCFYFCSYCMCSILQGMLGKIYYANVYSVACFALPLLLVAFKERKKKVLLFLWSESFKKENADCMLIVSSFLWICFMDFRCTKMNCITITFLQ